MERTQEFTEFLSSFHGKNCYIKETPECLASSIFYLNDLSIVDRYLSKYDDHKGNIRKMPIAPGVISNVQPTNLWRGYERVETEMDLYLPGDYFSGECFTGVLKRGGSSWNTFATKKQKQKNADKYWNGIKEGWENRDFDSRNLVAQRKWIKSI